MHHRDEIKAIHEDDSPKEGKQKTKQKKERKKKRGNTQTHNKSGSDPEHQCYIQPNWVTIGNHYWPMLQVLRMSAPTYLRAIHEITWDKLLKNGKKDRKESRGSNIGQ